MYLTIISVACTYDVCKIFGFLSSTPLLFTVTLMQLISTLICFWGAHRPVQTSYVHAP